MLETARERVSLLKAGVDGKTIEHLYIKLNNFKLVGCNSQKINCWKFVGCDMGEESVPEPGVCMALTNTSANGTNGGINGGVCWFISGTFNGDEVEGQYAKKLLSRSCKHFHKVREEEENTFAALKNNTNESMADTASNI